MYFAIQSSLVTVCTSRSIAGDAFLNASVVSAKAARSGAPVKWFQYVILPVPFLFTRAANADVADEPTDATAPAMALSFRRVLRERLPIRSCIGINFLSMAPPDVRLGVRLVTASRVGQ